MKLKRLEPGSFESEDGRVMIERLHDTCWSVAVDGKPINPDCESKAEAIEAAEIQLAITTVNKQGKLQIIRCQLETEWVVTTKESDGWRYYNSYTKEQEAMDVAADVIATGTDCTVEQTLTTQ